MTNIRRSKSVRSSEKKNKISIYIHYCGYYTYMFQHFMNIQIEIDSFSLNFTAPGHPSGENKSVISKLMRGKNTLRRDISL